MVSAPEFLSHPNFVLPIEIAHSGNASFVTVLIGSGATGNFIDQSHAERLHLPLQPLQHPLKVQALDGEPSGGGSVTHCTEPITMHHKNISEM